MREVIGEAKSVQQILANSKYKIDFYQREFKWQTKHVTELIDDLAVRFLEDYEAAHERKAVASYGHYFLGSIILSEKNGDLYIVDGQQRLTTLTLLLIYLNNLQEEREEQVGVEHLIYSEKYGEKSFNIDVGERVACMRALLENEAFDEQEEPESVRNIVQRYDDIDVHLPEELIGDALPFFIDWLIEKVNMVQITTGTDEDAYTVFETMNDRGLSLSPTDMLKGYLLSCITDETDRVAAATVWKDQLTSLSDLGKDHEADAFKAWLRGQHAQSIRERKRGATPGDFDRIGTEFHRWIRDHRDEIGLEGSTAFVDFIRSDMRFYTSQYAQLITASREFDNQLRTVYYNTWLGFTLQYPVLLAPLVLSDTDEIICKKLQLVGTFLDILLTRRMWNGRRIGYSTMQYAMFLLMRDVRGKAPEELVELLEERLAREEEDFSSNSRLALHQRNRFMIHYFLARMTDYIERESNMPSHWLDYTCTSGPGRYEIEHIWADHFERHTNEFAHPSDFQDHRNRIGGLLLLPRSFNASYGDLTYEEKLPHYNTRNLLARSLHSQAYERNPGFVRFIKESGLPFRPHGGFATKDLNARQELYQELAGRVWHPTRLRKVLDE